MALVIVMTTITLLTLLLVDIQGMTTTSFLVARNHRDRIQAEYMAKSGLNLTRLLVANEPAIRQLISPIYQAMVGRPPHQLPVWRYADAVLRPFCDYEGTQSSSIGSDFGWDTSQGLGKTPGTCSVVGVAENSKVNVNSPLIRGGLEARVSVATQTFGVMGGYQTPSPYDPLFDGLDADEQRTDRLDVISALIDWWDQDTEKTTFDPGSNQVTVGGAEDSIYTSFRDPYAIKNAPFDTLEEIRLIRGVTDEFWDTFVEPDSTNPDSRKLTIYGSGSVNLNDTPPEVVLATVCNYLQDQPLCSNPTESSKFIQLMSTARSLFPFPFFTRSSDLLNFIEGKGGGRDLYPTLVSFLGEEHPLLFTPVEIPDDMRSKLDLAFVAAARIIAIHSTGRVGNAVVRIRTVMNFHDRWSPPPPNAGSMPPLGIFHYYRID